MKLLVEMKDFIFRTFVNLITFGYERIFHEKMSDEVKKFFKNLSYVGFGTIIATIFSFTFNIIAGRILGPSGYGEFTLVQSVAMFLYIPMLLGFGTAMVKYNAEKEDYNRQRTIISTTYILVFIFTIGSIFIYYLFSAQISEIFHVSKEFFYLAVVFAVLFVFYTLTTSTLRSLHEMKKYAIFQPIYGIILLSAFLVFIFINFISFKSMVFSMYLAYGITGIALLILFLRKYLKFEFNKSWVNTLTKYGLFATIGGVSFTFYTNIDKILINKYMTIADVGIYMAYYFASINVLALFSGILITVFFPVASKYKNKEVIINRMNRFVPYLVCVGTPFVFLCEFAILNLYGGKYPIDFLLMLLFAATSILVAWYGIYAWLFNSEGMRGVKLTILGTATIAIINVLLNIYLIPRLGLFGAIGSTTTAFAVGICYLSLLKGEIE
jgi:O-antigen/teichoic acid export membrane protein